MDDLDRIGVVEAADALFAVDAIAAFRALIAGNPGEDHRSETIADRFDDIAHTLKVRGCVDGAAKKASQLAKHVALSAPAYCACPHRTSHAGVMTETNFGRRDRAFAIRKLKGDRSLQRRAGDTVAGHRAGFEPGLADRVAAGLTFFIRALLKSITCQPNVGEMPLRLQDQRIQLRALEGDRRAFRIVLVVGVRIGRGCHHRRKIEMQVRESIERAGPLNVQTCGSLGSVGRGVGACIHVYGRTPLLRVNIPQAR